MLPIQILFASPTTDLLVTGAVLAVALLIAALVVAVVGRWSKGPVVCPTDPHEEMTRFRLLRDQGQLSEEEFERVRKVMQAQIRQRLGENPTQEELERAAMELTPIENLSPLPNPGVSEAINPPQAPPEKT